MGNCCPNKDCLRPKSRYVTLYMTNSTRTNAEVRPISPRGVQLINEEDKKASLARNLFFNK